MSLINQALRKAQRDRTPERMPEPGASAPMQPAPASSSGMNLNLVIGLVVAIALLIGLVAGLTVVLLKGDSQPVEQVAAAPDQAPESPAATTETASAPETPALASLEPIAQPTSTPEPLQRDTSSPIVDELRQAREAAEARANAEPSEAIIDWLARARINGVKLSDKESRVILNGDSYGVGEYVNFDLGLRVMIIQEKRILFVDKNGKKYMKRL